MNLNFTLSEQDLAAVRQVVGAEIAYCVPADLSLEGRRVEGYLAIGGGRWAYVQDGQVRDEGNIADASDYKLVPFVGNAVLEATENETKRIVVRVTMQHAARYGYIAQILNDMAATRPIRIYHDEADPVCAACGRSLVPGTRVCPRCMSRTAAFKRLLLVSRRHWRGLMLGLGVLIVASGLAMAGPYFQKLLVNAALLPPPGKKRTLGCSSLPSPGCCSPWPSASCSASPKTGSWPASVRALRPICAKRYSIGFRTCRSDF